MNVCENFWMIDDGFVEIMLVYLINLLGFPYFVVLSENFSWVYGLSTWGSWVLCISRNWFEWVCLIFIEFYHSLVLSWCFGLEGIWFQTWALWVLSISRNWFEWVCLIKLLNLLIAPVRPRWLMADYLWGDRKKPTSRRRFSKPVVDVNDDFELNFLGFKDDRVRY